MKQLLLVFVGGGIGSVLRFLIGEFLHETGTKFPYGTFVVNVIGSFLIGVILGLAAKQNTLSQHQILFLATGFCGGFTTFSTFAFENYSFLKSGDFVNFAIYTMVSFVLGFLAVFAGISMAKYL